MPPWPVQSCRPADRRSAHEALVAGATGTTRRPTVCRWYGGRMSVRRQGTTLFSAMLAFVGAAVVLPAPRRKLSRCNALRAIHGAATCWPRPWPSLLEGGRDLAQRVPESGRSEAIDRPLDRRVQSRPPASGPHQRNSTRSPGGLRGLTVELLHSLKPPSLRSFDSGRTSGKRHMSTDAHRRIGLAMKKKWAERKKAARTLPGAST